MKTSMFLMALIVLVQDGRPAFANQIRVNFAGIVDDVADSFQYLPDELAPGDTITGYYVYDADTTDSNSVPNVGWYDYSLVPNGMVVYAENLVFRTDTANVDVRFIIGDSVVSGGDFDYVQFRSNDNIETSWGLPMGSMQIRLVDSTETAVPNDSLLLTAPDLSDWQDHNQLLIVGDGFLFLITAHLIATWSDVGSGVEDRIDRFLFLHQNYPNPFNPGTSIRFTLYEPADVNLSIYDARGRSVRTLVDARLGPGNYIEEWDGRDDRGREVVSGVYFYRLSTGTTTLTRKAVLLK